MTQICAIAQLLERQVLLNQSALQFLLGVCLEREVRLYMQMRCSWIVEELHKSPFDCWLEYPTRPNTLGFESTVMRMMMPPSLRCAGSNGD